MDGNAYVIVRAGAMLSDLSFEIRTSRISCAVRIYCAVIIMQRQNEQSASALRQLPKRAAAL